MEHNKILEMMNEVFVDVFDDKDILIEDKTTADDIEDWDSLAHLQLIMALERRFNIQFNISEIHSYANVGEMCDGIARHLNK